MQLVDALRLRPHLRRMRRWLRPTVRERIASEFVRGEGIELGALHRAFPVDERFARVQYVDRLPRETLREHYPELEGQPLLPVHILDDAETLSLIADVSQDFCIASHVLEHMEDPVAAVINWLRVTRPGGHVVLAVPLPDNPLDAFRVQTPLEHLESDHGLRVLDPIAWEHRRAAHYLEFASSVATSRGRFEEERVAAEARRLQEKGYSIHFHVFSDDSLRAFFELVRIRAPYAFELAEVRRGDEAETLVVLRRIS